MKATFNGITIEGTPQEIAEYQQLMELKLQIKPVIIEQKWSTVGRPEIDWLYRPSTTC